MFRWFSGVFFMFVYGIQETILYTVLNTSLFMNLFVIPGRKRDCGVVPAEDRSPGVWKLGVFPGEMLWSLLRSNTGDSLYHIHIEITYCALLIRNITETNSSC